MNPEDSLQDGRQLRRWRILLQVMAGMLVLALGSVGFLQVRQNQLLNATRNYQDDYMIWSLFQFEVESLRLRLTLEEATHKQEPIDAEQIEQRYEIFVSRLGLIEGEHATQVLREHPDYLLTLERAKRFVHWADALPLKAEWLRQHSELKQTEASLRAALTQLESLSSAVRELSLTASHHVAEQVDTRNRMVREQARMSLWLTILLCALTLSFAVLVLRQFRRLRQYGQEQHALVQRLQQAQIEAEAGGRAKTVFLANMSHELRTPMHGLLGMLDLLQDTPLSAMQKSQLRAAHDSSRHLLSVLNDILDVSKMEAGGIHIQPEPVCLPHLLRELDEISRPQAKAKLLNLVISADADVPEWISADPTRLRQILLNLLGNALKFSEHGQVQLHVSRQQGALGDTLLRCEVSDTGIGMDSDTLSKLFQRFSQGDATRSRRFGGTGLGLEISRNLARAMGGDISVHSSTGVGSTFTVDLPLIGCSAPTHSAGAAGSAAPTGMRLRILVSEDNATNRSYLQAVLERLGHPAFFCENGHEALQALAQQDFDLVLMDLHTPIMDGYESARAMRRLPAPKCQVRIIALSADAFAESRQRALQAGMDDFLPKPIGVEALSRALNQIALQLPLQVGFEAGSSSTQESADQAAQKEDAEARDLDMATLASLRTLLSAATVRQLYASYLQGLDDTRTKLHTALQARQNLVLSETAHGIKGAAANLGLNAVARAAQALELQSKPAQPSLDKQYWSETEALTLALLEALGNSEALCHQHHLV